jgi:hypothetical protein
MTFIYVQHFLSEKQTDWVLGKKQQNCKFTTLVPKRNFVHRYVFLRLSSEHKTTKILNWSTQYEQWYEHTYRYINAFELLV